MSMARCPQTPGGQVRGCLFQPENCGRKQSVPLQSGGRRRFGLRNALANVEVARQPLPASLKGTGSSSGRNRQWFRVKPDLSCVGGDRSWLRIGSARRDRNHGAYLEAGAGRVCREQASGGDGQPPQYASVRRVDGRHFGAGDRCVGQGRAGATAAKWGRGSQAKYSRDLRRRYWADEHQCLFARGYGLQDPEYRSSRQRRRNVYGLLRRAKAARPDGRHSSPAKQPCEPDCPKSASPARPWACRHATPRLPNC
jgi:hypothetical protein